jgi:hypothetical protein
MTKDERTCGGAELRDRDQPRWTRMTGPVTVRAEGASRECSCAWKAALTGSVLRFDSCVSYARADRARRTVLVFWTRPSWD